VEVPSYAYSHNNVFVFWIGYCRRDVFYSQSDFIPATLPLDINYDDGNGNKDNFNIYVNSESKIVFLLDVEEHNMIVDERTLRICFGLKTKLLLH
jgi:hypothetical protein